MRKFLLLVIISCFVSIPIIFLTAYSQPFLCNCQNWTVVNFDIWSALNSQTLFDPYSLSHLCHGLLLTLLVGYLFKFPKATLIAVCAVVETLWEVVENSPMMIERYRKATIAVGYSGDSVVNSMSDLTFALLGALIATNLSKKSTLGLVVLLELTSLFWIKDNLTLNILMLFYPIPEIAEWQRA
jgi:hypothetical protein